ncbi:hypothetical protein [Streptomyces sp. NPDC002671]
MTQRTERDEILDFPGADELIAAGAVAPNSASRITIVPKMLALLAERESQPAAAPVPDAVLPDADEELIIIGVREPTKAWARQGRFSRRRVLIAASAAAVVTLGAISYPALDVGGKPASTASPASTAAFLKEMAEVSAEQAPLPSGGYWKVRIETLEGTTRTNTWYGDRTGDMWERRPDGKVVKSPKTWWTVGRRFLAWPELDRLPTDPKVLAPCLARSPLDRFEQATKLLEDSPASPQLRSALFMIIGDIPGVKLKGSVKDSHGRPGTAIALPVKLTFKDKNGSLSHVWSSQYVVIDRKTARILETRNEPSTELIGHRTFLEVGWTNRID